MTASTPTDNNHASSKHTTLRDSAKTEMRHGNLDINSGWVLPAETLGLLYKMASDPNSAADALKLLHELQTHQVELELQYRQLLHNEQFIKDQLSKFKSLLDVSTIGYIMADVNAQIMEINSAAIKLLAIDDQTVVGQPVSNFFHADAQSNLRGIFKQLAENKDGEDAICIETPRAEAAKNHQLKITACISHVGHAVLMTLMDYSPSATN